MSVQKRLRQRKMKGKEHVGGVGNCKSSRHEEKKVVWPFWGKEINRHWGRRKDWRCDGKKGRMPGSSGSSYLWSQITTAGKNLPDDWINHFLFLPALCKWFWLGWDPRKAWEKKQSKSREMIIRWNKHGHVLKAARPFAALGKHTLVTSLFSSSPLLLFKSNHGSAH